MDAGLKAIFLAQRSTLVRMLTARLGSQADAEDIVQEMWLKLHQTARQPIGQPAAFLYRVAANLATDRRIAASRRSSRETAWSEHQPGAEEIPTAERVLVARSEWHVVEAAIADMPDRMATALRLFRIEGMSQQTIAHQLGISVSGVEKLLQRAYRKIHEELTARTAELPAPQRHNEERGVTGDD